MDYAKISLGVVVIVAAILGFIILSGCVSNEESKNIGGKYNATLFSLESPVDEPYRKSFGKDFYEEKGIQYSIGDKQFRGSYFPDFWQPATDSIEWIKSNTSEDSIFLNWWDYGHTIRGATGRDVVITSPSKEGSKHIAMIGKMITEKTYEEKYGYETQEKMEDVGTALTTDNIEITNQIMDKYNAKYIYTTMRDLDIISIMDTKGGYYTERNMPEGKQYDPSKRFYNSTLAKLHLFKGRGLENYRLVYESQPNSQSNEKQYKNNYNTLYGDNIQVDDSGYIKIFEYVKGAK